MKCIVCQNQLTEQLPWLFRCDCCGFNASTLVAGSGRGIDGLEILRRKNFRRLCDRLEGRWVLRGKSVLEVGCAEGWFLDEALRRGMVAKAIEPSSPHAEYARSRGFDVVTGYFPDDLGLDQRFDFVVFNDVFEHLPDPVRAIKHCQELLRPGGVLVLNLPSNNGVIYRMANLIAKFGRAATLERLWQKGFPSPHLSYFNPSTIKRFVTQQTDLDHVSTFPLDAVVAEGLGDRIEASHPGPMGKVLSIGLVLAIPILNILPSDIIVGVFQKSP
jgi:SAM-dependent methyltransferase